MAKKDKKEYLTMLKESMIDFDKMDVNKGPVEDIISFSGEGDLKHHEPIDGVVSILENFYDLQENDGRDVSKTTVPAGLGPATGKDAENSDPNLKKLGDIADDTAEGQSSGGSGSASTGIDTPNAGSGGTGTLPNGEQPDAYTNNIMDSDMSLIEALFDEDDDTELISENIEEESEPVGKKAMDKSAPKLGDNDDNTDFNKGAISDKSAKGATADPIVKQTSESFLESLFEENDLEDEGDDANIVDPEEGTGTIGDADASELEEGEMEAKYKSNEMEEDDANLNSEPEGEDVEGGEEGEEEEAPLEVPAAPAEENLGDDTMTDQGEQDNMKVYDQKEGGEYMEMEDDYDTSGEPGMESDGMEMEMGGDLRDGGLDKNMQGMEMDDEGTEAGKEDLNLPEENGGEAGTEGDTMKDEDDYEMDEFTIESLFEEEMDDAAEIEKLDKSGDIKPADLDADEMDSAKIETKLENTILARQKVEESVVERLIREMENFNEEDEFSNDLSDNVNENGDDLED